MLNGYPRPQLERKEWLNLNGEWQFLFDDEKRGEKEKWYEHFLEETGRIQGRTLMKQNTVESVRKNFIRLSGITGR